MKRNRTTALLTLCSILALACVHLAQQIGEAPAIANHLDQTDIEEGRVPLQEIIAHGERLFMATFNRLDGQGRQGSRMIRTTGPEAHSCVSCHNRPRPGGGGDFPTNVFVAPEGTSTDSVSAEFSNERRTLGLFGSGPIEMLAREMTWELRMIRLEAVHRAYLTFSNVSSHLVAKGVDFGTIVAHPDGTLDTSGVRGVSPDLTIRPFHQSGTAVSLRHFTNDAMAQHMGIQSVERFGLDVDADGDGIVNELTVGDVTAISIFQAQLGTPGQVLPENPVKRRAAEEGEKLFEQVGCTECHIPSMKLKSAIFSEANPFNPEWKLPVIVKKPVSFDMTRDGEWPRLEATEDGGAIVRAYTDLKRHSLCDAEDQFFCNERVTQDGVPVSTFLTRKLWDAGSSAPYGHRGDLSTLTEAIEHHAGEARSSRERFSELSSYGRSAVVEFLKTLQIRFSIR